ncbi:MAG: hypothetical protein II670_13065 [Alphaproteobacteria bacterium]|nr:hypothetical protein [Alphaproteobacteria bacterium]
MKAKTAIILFSILVVVAISLILIHTKEEILKESESIVIIGENPDAASAYEISYKCIPRFWSTEEDFIKNADWQIELDLTKSRELYAPIKRMLSSKKEITTVYRPVFDMSFLTGEQTNTSMGERIPVTDSDILIFYILYKKRDGKIVNKMLIGGSNIIRIDEKYYEVDTRKKMKVNNMIETKMVP